MPLDGKKSPRQFDCSDVLWRTFVRMSEEQDKDVDDLISDAMVAYAQLSGYQTGLMENEVTPPPAPAARSRLGPSTPPGAIPPPVSTRFGRPSGYAGNGEGAGGAAGAGLGAGLGSMAPTPPPAAPPPPPRGAPAPEAAAAASSAPPLYLVFDNQKYRIDKDQFIIGRGAKSSDLPIKDGNISRKHAAVIRRNGTYFIKDLGSTNGIDFKGMRIDNKRIDEGDTFHLCDYELRFTYRR
jgi:hypothetical protein